MSRKSLTIAVSDRHMADILEVAQHLQDAGLQVEQVMDDLGIITGACDDAQISAVKNVEGVDSVDEDMSFHLAPPDSPVQ